MNTLPLTYNNPTRSSFGEDSLKTIGDQVALSGLAQRR